MMKKILHHLPFVLGIVLIAMVAVTAAVIANVLPCNGLKRSNQKPAMDVCQSALLTVYCNFHSNSYLCMGMQETVAESGLFSSGTPLLYTSRESGEATDHAVEFLFTCGTVYNCQWDSGLGKCILGSVARNPLGEPIRRYTVHYDNDSCVVGGAG